ncbi:MAG: heavy metal-associated domain-containing protein [Myxococcales bacterium]|nr:heavy-metal-associated domain-containing protein [Polyangiaceae bacterium]MDW8248353.1 heavy metal-associated domain-containing protein [Myxococcales bacterium]
MEVELKVEGMHCQACVRRVRKALEQIRGIEILEVSVGSVRVRGIKREQAEDAVSRAGFSVVVST